MMLNKKLIIITLILLSLFMIGTASAATDTDQVNSDVTHKEKVSHKDNVADKNTDTIIKKKSVNTKENKDKISSTPHNNDVLKSTDNGTFTTLNKNNDKDTLKETTPINNWTDLQKAINNGTEDIKLTNNITTNGRTIIINNGKVRINGDGHTIDAEKKGTDGIFYLGEGASLILENLKIINGNTTSSGGAIYTQDNCNLTVTNCTFNQNTAKNGYGGAIHTNVNCKLTVTNCTFNQNTANNGGAICTQVKCNLTVTNCTFNQNTAKNGYGGAISTGGDCDVNVDNALFCNNNAQSGEGIYCNGGSGTRIIKNSAFINDEYNGINAEGKIEQTNDIYSFTALNAIINAGDHHNPIIELTNNYTYNTTSESDQQFIHGIPITKKVIIKGNGYTINGSQEARIFKVTNGAHLTLINCTLTQGKGQNEQLYTGEYNVGGAIFINSSGSGSCNVIIINTTFNNNTATNGGAIYTYTYSTGGSSSSNVIIINTTFTNNTAGYSGGAIYTGTYSDNMGSGSCNVTLINTTFNNNTANIAGGAIYTYTSSYDGGSSSSCNVTLINTTFNNNTASYGGAIYTQTISNGGSSGCNVTLINTTFNNNQANTGTLGSSYGGAIYNDRGNLTVTNSTFNNNQATTTGTGGNSYGGAIYNDCGNLTVTNSTFNNNQANTGTLGSSYGGAISNDRGNLTVTNSTFNNNQANTGTDGNSYGGAISNDRGNLTVTNSTFNNNQANTGTDGWSEGGAIYTRESYLNITQSTLQNNTADYGGAINADNSQVNITQSTLTNNNATNRGGAIYVYAWSKLNLTSSLFMDNNVDGNGGAIYGDSFDDLTVNHNIFLNNTGNNVIYLYNDTSSDSGFVYNLDCNWFGNNATDYKNMPDVKSNIENLEFNNWLFLNATADPNPVQVLSSSNITFELYLYNSTSKNATVYNYSQLKPVNLTIDYNPNIYKSFALLGEKIQYTASSPGSDSVTACISNVEYSINLEITQIPTNITVNTNPITLNVTDTLQINAKLEPSGAGSLNYTSSNESVVTVDSTGNITAVGQGIANITVSFAGQGNYAAAENKTILVTVNLKDASVSVNNDTLDLFVDGTFTLVATTTPGGLDVTYVPDDSGVVSVDKYGLVTALKEGSATILVKVGGDGVYALNSTKVAVNVKKIPTTISIENNNITITATENTTTGATLNPTSAGSLKYTSNDTHVAIVRDGKIIAIGAGVANITVSFAGDEKYASADNKTILVTVNLKEINTQITGLTIPTELFEGKTSNITGTLTANGKKLANQKITIQITNNHGYKETFTGTTDANGKFNIKIKPSVNGPITITTTYNGQKTNKYDYKATNNSISKNVQKVVYTIKLDTLQPSYNYNTKVNITGQITSNYKPLDVKNVNITINGVRKTVALNNKGEFKYTSPYTTAGLYKVLVNCSGTIKTSQYFIKYPTKFTIQKIPNITQGSKIQLTITEKNKYSGLVKVTIGSETYTVKLNKGTGKKTVTPKLAPGKYLAKIRFTGDKKYGPANAVSNKFQVTTKQAVKLDTKIIAVKKTFYVEDTTKKYNISLKDANGKIVKNAIVTLKVKGKTYKTKTNNKGVATFDLNNLDQKGQYNSLIKYAGDKNYKASNKKVKITVKIRFQTVSKGSKDKKTVKKIQKALKKNGYYLHAGKYYLKIDGIYYNWTQKEVQRYQKNNKLPVTGKVDYETAIKLGII